MSDELVGGLLGDFVLFEFCKHGGEVTRVEPMVVEVQHGTNPEHRRQFSLRLLVESEGKAVLDWFDEIHAHEGAVDR